MEKNMLIPLARDFSLKAHKGIHSLTINGLVRPQTIHLQEVADLVWASGGTDEEIAAAWLHDVVEDTSTTIEDVTKHFGKIVSKIVYGLTDHEEITALPLIERKQRQAMRVHNESDEVRRIKIADQTSNVNFIAHDPTVRKTPLECKIYLEGAKLIADECRGVSPLLDKLFIDAYEKGMLRYAHI